MTDRFKLTIDRKIWIRGTGHSALLMMAGDRRCCVGIYLSALGWEDDELHGSGAADDVATVSKPIPVWLGKGYLPGRTHDAQALYRINDLPLGEVGSVDGDPVSHPSSLAIMLDEGDRENRVAEVFARNGVDVEFVGP